MRKIFYICTKHIENWEVFVPPGSMNTSQSNISVLLLHKEQDSQNVQASQVWTLNPSEQDTVGTNAPKSISYQDFLEQIFLHDLALVI